MMVKKQEQFDLIGDIHGHASKLVELLEHLDYRETSTGFAHPSRRAIFLGDFIDGADDLGEHRQLLDMIMAMVDNEHALAVMANHEFNALAYHTEDPENPGEHLRRRTEQRQKQHQAFLIEYDQPDSQKEKQKVLDFFYRLPLWIEHDGFRVVHACWSQKHIDYLSERLIDRRLTPELLELASRHGSDEFEAVEIILKGIETSIEDLHFHDKRGIRRTAMRVQWWKPAAQTLDEVKMPDHLDLKHLADRPVPAGVPVYPASEKPCFIGHYWLNGEPAPIATNVACLDYSVARGGKLVAYRWDGERVLRRGKFVYVDD